MWALQSCTWWYSRGCWLYCSNVLAKSTPGSHITTFTFFTLEVPPWNYRWKHVVGFGYVSGLCFEAIIQLKRFLSSSAMLLPLQRYCILQWRPWGWHTIFVHQLGPRCPLQSCVTLQHDTHHGTPSVDDMSLLWSKTFIVYIMFFLLWGYERISRWEKCLDSCCRLTSTAEFLHLNPPTPLTRIRGFSPWRC